MRFFVTGSTGFVGGALVRELRARGHDVVEFTRATGNLSSADDLAKAMAGCDGVFHVAGNTSWWRRDRRTVRHANVESTRAIVEAMKRTGIRRGVLTSSVSAVGITNDPARPADEATPFNWPAHFHYPQSKREAEEIAFGGGMCAVNPASVFGPGDAKMTVGILFRKVRDGKLPRFRTGGFSAVDVRDVADGHIAAFEKGKPGERYILAGANLENHALGDLIARQLGVPAPAKAIAPVAIRTFGAVLRGYEWCGGKAEVAAAHVWCMTRFVYHSADRAKRDLGFSPRPFDDTVRDSIAWYREKGLL